MAIPNFIRHNPVSRSAARLPQTFWIMLGLVAIFFITLLYARLQLLPYRLFNSDIFHQLAVLKEFGHGSHIKDPYFSDGPADLHAGPYYYLIFMFSQLMGISNYTSLYFMIALNALFLSASLYFVGRSFELKRSECAYLIVISIFGWGSFNFFFAGIFEYTNLLVSGSFPATLGLSLILINLALAKRAMIEQTKMYFVLLAVLGGSLLVSHILSGVILISLIGLLMAERLIVLRRIDAVNVGIGAALLAGIGLAIFIWPPFGIFDLISQSKTVEVGSSDKVTENLFAVGYWPQLLGVTALGTVFLPYLVKHKKPFIAFVALFSALMTASYMLPVRVSLYWRYFPILFLGLALSLAVGIRLIPTKTRVIFIFCLVIIGTLNIRDRMHILTKQTPTARDQYFDIARVIPAGSVVFSDPNTAYHLAALYDIRVTAVPYNHANPAYIKPSKERYEDAIALLQNRYDGGQEDYFKKHKVDYVVINRTYYPDYIKLLAKRDWLKDFFVTVPNTRVYQNGPMEVLRLHE